MGAFGGERRVGRRAGASLAEVLVALTILGIGGSLSFRLLAQAEREIQGAEVGLRAALLLAEASGGSGAAPGATTIPAGSGSLSVAVGRGMLVVAFEPPSGRAGVARASFPGAGGYLEARSWRLEAPP